MRKQCTNIVERARAAGTYIDARYPHDSRDRDRMQLRAFLSVFHPDMSADDIDRLLAADDAEDAEGGA